ncbi:hypothetical protein B0H13DRAFT_1928989 [Mycena leptocephala]|nr:hypothetical protein B0H13DRAFT_1928989 [Mycena leptocephala]
MFWPRKSWANAAAPFCNNLMSVAATTWLWADSERRPTQKENDCFSTHAEVDLEASVFGTEKIQTAEECKESPECIAPARWYRVGTFKFAPPLRLRDPSFLFAQTATHRGRGEGAGAGEETTARRARGEGGTRAEVKSPHQRPYRLRRSTRIPEYCIRDVGRAAAGVGRGGERRRRRWRERRRWSNREQLEGDANEERGAYAASHHAALLLLPPAAASTAKQWTSDVLSVPCPESGARASDSRSPGRAALWTTIDHERLCGVPSLRTGDIGRASRVGVYQHREARGSGQVPHGNEVVRVDADGVVWKWGGIWSRERAGRCGCRLVLEQSTKRHVGTIHKRIQGGTGSVSVLSVDDGKKEVVWLC